MLARVSWMTLVSVLVAAPAVLMAQDDGGDAGAATNAMPSHTGSSSVEAPIGQRGATLELTRDRSRPTLTLPPGLPIGNSRMLTFSIHRQRPRPSQVHERFVRFGPTLHFSSAINASRHPLTVSLRIRTQPVRRGMKLILAWEQPGFCDESNEQYSLGNGLCSTWQTVDATWDASTQLVRAQLEATGGLRLQFGWVPEDVAAEE